MKVTPARKVCYFAKRRSWTNGASDWRGMVILIKRSSIKSDGNKRLATAAFGGFGASFRFQIFTFSAKRTEGYDTATCVWGRFVGCASNWLRKELDLQAASAGAGNYHQESFVCYRRLPS